MEVELSSTAFKALKNLQRNDLLKTLKIISVLESDPFPHGSIKLAGEKHTYRIRTGDYRIIYEVNNNILLILVLKIGHRKDVYK
jgi:mRNA interferase RelE/StbE